MNKIKLRIKELYIFGLYLIAGLTVWPFRKKQIWLVSERGHEARDNGYWFFLYLKQFHPEIKSKYIIDRKSVDRDRLIMYADDLIDYGSFKHFYYLRLSSHLISTHIMGYTPFMDFFVTLDKKYNLFRDKKKIFLQHGITKNRLLSLVKGAINVDLFCCGAKPEYDYILNNFGHSDQIVKYTGFCRYDNLNDFKVKKQILVMPTWRMYLRGKKFTETDFFHNWVDFLQSKRLHDILINYGYELVFYPHYEMQQYVPLFKQLNISSYIYIAGFDYDVQTLLKESALLITDYSSVYFDMLYMHKPIIFYQFDFKEFYSKHYPQCFITEAEFGDIAETKDSVIDYIEDNIKNDCKISIDKLPNILNLYEIRDSNNCQRVYNAITELQ